MAAFLLFDSNFGGERGIRTLGRLLTYTRFPGVRLKPLIHLSGKRELYPHVIRPVPPRRPFRQRRG